MDWSATLTPAHFARIFAPLSLVTAARCAATGLDDHLKSGFERSLSWMGGCSAVPPCRAALSILVWWPMLSAVVVAYAV